MKNSGRTRKALITHYQQYPQLQIQDLFKYLHQSSYGCEHMVSSLETATDFIRKESECVRNNSALVDRLDGNYSRVHLAYLEQGLTPDTLGRLFFESAKIEPDGKENPEHKLSIAKELINEKLLPFSADEFDEAVKAWQAQGYPAVHHSDIFRNAYAPAYRVISNRFIPFLPLFAAIDKALEKDRVILAIEGGSASGKTTLSQILKDIYGCTVFHMDDFFLRPVQRTRERLAEVGGNIDRERFLEEVLIPLSKNEPVRYRRFDCATFELSPVTEVIPEKLTVIEGAYSMHPSLSEYYDISVFLDISPELQRQRIAVRNSPQFAERFYNEWIPLENVYFSQMQVKQHCSMRIEISE